MENVKGLLSSTISGRPIFERILHDLSRPGGGGVRYKVVALGAGDDRAGQVPDFVVRSELFGIPQARHRVILCGIREDMAGRPLPLVQQPMMSIERAIGDLAPLRSRLSREADSHESWISALDEAVAISRRSGRAYADVTAAMREAATRAARRTSTGAAIQEYRRGATRADPTFRAWVDDPRMPGITDHQTRGHMRTDLHRYLFASSFAAVRGYSPKLRDFPRRLLPDHENAIVPNASTPFEDRFRVQVAGRPASTIVSHISKDGHYFIHPDSSQCRSLTVREAARLQTFPDNYHFEGNRTQKFVQVGNAVPPMLAGGIGLTVGRYLTEMVCGSVADAAENRTRRIFA